MLGLGSFRRWISRTTTLTWALFVASETVEVRTAPPRTLVEGQGVEAPQMESLGGPSQ